MANYWMWMKIGVVVACLCIANLIIAVLLISESAVFLGARKSKMVVLSDLFFLEGAVVLAVGALTAAGTSLRRESFSSLYAKPDGHRKFLEEQRPKQFFFGILLIIIGAVLIGLSVIVTISTL